MNKFFQNLEDAEKLLLKAETELAKVQKSVLDNKAELHERLNKLASVKNRLTATLKTKREEFLKTLISFALTLGINYCRHSSHTGIVFISVDEFKFKTGSLDKFNFIALMAYLHNDYNDFCARLIALIEDWLSKYPTVVDESTIGNDQLVSMRHQLLQIFENAPQPVS